MHKTDTQSTLKTDAQSTPKRWKPKVHTRQMPKVHIRQMPKVHLRQMPKLPPKPMPKANSVKPHCPYQWNTILTMQGAKGSMKKRKNEWQKQIQKHD